MTLFYKRVFPVLWFGFLAAFAVTSLVHGGSKKALLSVAASCIMAVIGFFVMRRMVWNLADEVLDGGDFLLIKHRGYQERVPLANIINVSAATNQNPPRISLRLSGASLFGAEVAFSPKARFSFNAFGKNPIVEDLIMRADRARRVSGP